MYGNLQGVQSIDSDAILLIIQGISQFFEEDDEQEGHEGGGQSSFMRAKYALL